MSGYTGNIYAPTQNANGTYSIAGGGVAPDQATATQQGYVNGIADRTQQYMNLISSGMTPQQAGQQVYGGGTPSNPGTANSSTLTGGNPYNLPALPQGYSWGGSAGAPGSFYIISTSDNQKAGTYDINNKSLGTYGDLPNATLNQALNPNWDPSKFPMLAPSGTTAAQNQVGSQNAPYVNGSPPGQPLITPQAANPLPTDLSSLVSGLPDLNHSTTNSLNNAVNPNAISTAPLSSTAINNGQDPTSANALAKGLPSGNGTLQKISGQSTSEGTAGTMGTGQVDGAMGTGGINTPLVGGSSNPAGVNSLPLPTSTGGTNNDGLGQGASTTTTTATTPSPHFTQGSGTTPVGLSANMAPTQGLPDMGGFTPPAFTNPYANLSNPYTEAYQQALAGQGLSGAQDQYAIAQQQIRNNYAARGLANAGPSGAEMSDLSQAALQAAQARAAALNNAQLQTTQLGANYGMQLAQGNLGANAQQYGQAVTSAQLPDLLAAQHISNEEHQQNLNTVTNNWDAIQQKVNNGLALSNAELQFMQTLAGNPALAAAMGILPGVLQAAGTAAGGLVGSGIAGGIGSALSGAASGLAGLAAL